jgi:demethylspheroidene O-methyltransferase
MASVPSGAAPRREGAPPGPASARERFKRWRDRLLADRRFHRWAAGTPLVRRTASRHTAELFDLCAGFVYSQVLASCVALDVFERVAAAPVDPATLAGEWRMGLPAAARLIDAAVALRLLERREGGIGLGRLGAALRGNPGVLAMVRHHALLYADLAEPLPLLRGTAEARLGRFWPYATGATANAAESADYTELMSASQHLVAQDVLDAYPMGRHRLLLDIGGGDASFALAAAARAPQLQAIVADLPGVTPAAQRAIAAAGSGRVAPYPCDALRDPLPAGCDVATFVRVLHDHDDVPARALLAAAHAALVPGGTLLIAEPMADTPGAERVGAYFAFYLLAMGSGRPRSADELAAFVRAAGFGDVRELPTRRPLLVRLLAARRIAPPRHA